MRPKPLNWWRQQRASAKRRGPEPKRGVRRVLGFPWPLTRDLAQRARELPGGWLATLERHGELGKDQPRRSWLARLLGR